MKKLTSFFFEILLLNRLRIIGAVLIGIVLAAGGCTGFGVFSVPLKSEAPATSSGAAFVEEVADSGGGPSAFCDMENMGPENLIRFHILANSDSVQDQELKYAVRDAVVALVGPRLVRLSNLDEARRELQAAEEMMRVCAQEVIRQRGFSYPVVLVWEVREFPTRAYGNVTLPAGEYEAVRILIGEAEGANWWCVLFPPLCFVQEADPSPGSGTAGIDAAEGVSTVGGEAAANAETSVGVGRNAQADGYQPEQCQKKFFFIEFVKGLFER
ncbi:MAG: stage II sporulation protein R [Peptococcaceae bacterium]|nr:stage II sporulation protein R [Peptococcaceae bacterium]